MPTPPIKAPQLGRHLTSFLMQAYDVVPGSAGSPGATLQASGSPVSLLAQLDDFDYEIEPESEEINSITSTRRNMVNISEGSSATINIWKVNDGNDPNPLRTAAQSHEYFTLTWVEGTITGFVGTCVMWGLRGKLSGGYRGRGKQIASFSLQPCDIGAAQFSVTYA